MAWLFLAGQVFFFCHGRTGSPIGNDFFIDQLESETGRCLRKKKPGPKEQRKNSIIKYRVP